MVSLLGWDIIIKCAKCGMKHTCSIDALPFEAGGLNPIDMECTRCGHTRHTITAGAPAGR